VEILQVLWEIGPTTVRNVHAMIGRGTGYTSTLKLMQIMTDKGLLTRVKRGRGHIYRPSQPEARTQVRLVGDLIDRAFGGSARKLIVAALSSRHSSREELEEIRRLLQSDEGDPS
jgi:predicted transcriptional regulator